MSSAKINKMLIEIIMVLFPTMIATIPFGAGNFILPPQGGGVIHQDLNMSENLWYTCPTQNVGQLWYQDDLENLGAIAGTMGNGIVGNGHIAANSFGPFSFSGCKLRPNDKLLLFDYFGNILWRSGAWNLLLERGEFNYSLNPYATASSPMIDIHNRVVACDSERIILVNASDLNHITVDWVTNLTKLSSQNLRNRTVPFSPCPVGNHSFILPTHNGPVYLFDTDTGTPLANITLGKNTTLGEFWGIPKMNISDFLKIHTDFILHGISPFQYNSTSGRIEWNSEIPYGIMPLKRNHFIDYIHGKAFFYEENTVTYKERVSPFNWTIIASNEIQAPQICTEEGYFSTINSACVDGNKVYLATEYTMPDFSQYKVYNLSSGVNSTIGRLYAINVTPNAINESDRLVELWNYTYIGKSQATPTLINDTIYFDGSYDLDGSIVNWTWDFNDGNYSYEQNPTHLYTSVEDYTITLTVQDDDGGINSVSRKVFDLVAPEFSNITSFPECQISGGFVNLSALVTDNVMVDDVYVNILHPDMVVENISITQNKTGDIYYCNNTYQQSGIYVYHIWANDISGNTNISGSYIFLINNPPVFLVPSPVNNSINNPLSFIWSIPISDPEGDLFSWTIQCSNTQTNSGTGATNGTKTLSLSGLTYSTTHKVWVNATDPTGSNQYTRAWYTFTTEAQNFPPVFGTPTPVNGSTNQPLIFNWSIPINDPEGDLFSWTIQCSNGQNSNGTGETNGTKTLALLLPFDSVYTVWVNATDPDGSGNYTRAWYWFTTKANLPPVFGSSNPANGSINQPLSFTWSIPINDSEGDLFSWTIQCSNEQTNSGTGASNGTKSLTLSGLAYLTTYKVWVNATDPTGSGLYTRRCYTFTTQQQQNEPPNKPNKPSGETNGKINTLYTYSTSTTDPNGDQVSYKWDWGDGTQSNWLGPYNSGITINTTHTWTKKGNYGIKVKAKDIYNAESNWSDPLPITMPYSYNNPIQQFFKMLIERFPNMFPILRHLLRY
jgi:hypothetical protein